MAIRYVVIYLFACILLLSGCAETNKFTGPKLEVKQYSVETVTIEKPLDLSIISDSGNIEIYTWNKKEIKFEITKKIKGFQNKETLERNFYDFQLKIEKENDKVNFNVKYKGKINSPIDRSVDLKIFIPQKISNIDCKMDLGKIKILDEIKCNLKIEINMVDTEINMFQGKLIFKGDMGDLRINNGRILADSSVKINIGSIIIKGALASNGEYDFETGIGNLDLTFPKKSKIKVESIGTLDVNEFEKEDSETRVKVNTGMGKISLTKY